MKPSSFNGPSNVAAHIVSLSIATLTLSAGLMLLKPHTSLNLISNYLTPVLAPESALTPAETLFQKYPDEAALAPILDVETSLQELGRIEAAYSDLGVESKSLTKPLDFVHEVSNESASDEQDSLGDLMEESLAPMAPVKTVTVTAHKRVTERNPTDDIELNISSSSPAKIAPVKVEPSIRNVSTNTRPTNATKIAKVEVKTPPPKPASPSKPVSIKSTPMPPVITSISPLVLETSLPPMPSTTLAPIEHKLNASKDNTSSNKKESASTSDASVVAVSPDGSKVWIQLGDFRTIIVEKGQSAPGLGTFKGISGNKADFGSNQLLID